MVKLLKITAKKGYIELKYGKNIIPIGNELKEILDDAFIVADRLLYDKDSKGFIYTIKLGEKNED